MYICPNCQRKFSKESTLVKHLSSCWKEQHPDCIHKSAPRSEDKETRQVSDDIMNFFNSFKE